MNGGRRPMMPPGARMLPPGLGMPANLQRGHHPPPQQPRFAPGNGIAHVTLPSSGPPVGTVGRPPPITVIEIERPLSNEELVDNNRGNGIVLEPPADSIPYDEFGQKFVTHSVVSGRTGNCKRGELIGITLGLTLKGEDDAQTDIEAAFVHPMVRANIGWGLGSASYTAVCDWKNGTQISIEAEYIQYVNATYVISTTPWDEVSPSGAPPFRVNAGFAYGGVGRAANPATFTEIVQIEHPIDAPRIVQVPHFAQSLTILPVNGASVGAKVYGFGSFYHVDWTTTTPLSNAQVNQPTRIPLQNGARFVEITNTQGTDIAAVAFLVFELAL